MQEAIAKADALIEAMAYIRAFRGREVVLKLGGSVLDDETAQRNLLTDVAFMATVGMRPIIVHGGGWGTGDKRKGMEPFFEPLNKAGDFTWFSINYRLAPSNHWPACLEDVQTAIRWVKSHAKEYKGDPQRLALMGYSAGGELVCLAAVLAKEDTQVQAVVGFSPPTDLVADTQRRGGLSKSLQALFGREAVDDQTRPLLKEMSPINFVKPGLPPFLLIQGDADKTVPYEQSVNFQARLKENHVPCEFSRFPFRVGAVCRWDVFARRRWYPGVPATYWQPSLHDHSLGSSSPFMVAFDHDRLMAVF